MAVHILMEFRRSLADLFSWFLLLRWSFPWLVPVVSDVLVDFLIFVAALLFDQGFLILRSLGIFSFSSFWGYLHFMCYYWRWSSTFYHLHVFGLQTVFCFLRTFEGYFLSWGNLHLGNRIYRLYIYSGRKTKKFLTKTIIWSFLNSENSNI